MMKGDSFSYLGKPYTRGTGTLAIGDKVYVHPTPTSLIRHRYKAEIVTVETGGIEQLCTKIPNGGHTSAMREYLFNRLEKIQDGQ